MTLRFYRGGPVAVRGYEWWVTADGSFGCSVAIGVGAIIPRTTYLDADPGMSQGRDSDAAGLNKTALLPIEE